MPTSRASRIWFYQHLQVRRHPILDENNMPKAWCPSSDCHGHHVMSFHMHIHIHIYIPYVQFIFIFKLRLLHMHIKIWIQSILRILIHVHNHILYLYLEIWVWVISRSVFSKSSSPRFTSPAITCGTWASSTSPSAAWSNSPMTSG